MQYKVQYKRGWFWRTLRNVKSDSAVNLCTAIKNDDGTIHVHAISHVAFVFEDNSQAVIPTAGTSFRFPKERFLAIRSNAESEAGQSIPTK